MKRITVCTSIAFFLVSFAEAQASMADDQANQMPQTTAAEPITNTEKRIEIIRVNPQGKKMDDQIKELMGTNSENMYRTTADFLPYILQMGQGDPTRMVEFLTKASRDPASFTNSLPQHLKQNTTDLNQKVKPLPEQRRP